MIFSGALLIGPSADHLKAGGEGGEALLILGATYNVVALGVATSLSIYRPSTFRRAKRTDTPREYLTTARS